MAGHLPDYADLHPVTGTLLQQLDHLAIAYFHVVNQKFLFGSFDEIGELFASIQWTDQEAGRTRFIGTPLAVTVEQIFSFLDELLDRKSTRLNSSHRCISYAVFCLKKKKK